MKVQMNQLTKSALAIALLTGSIALISAAKPEKNKNTNAAPAGFFRPGTINHYDQDTLPRHSKKRGDVKEINLGDMKLDDFEKVQRDLDKSMADLEKNLQQDFKKQQEDLKKTMASIDHEKILKEVEASLAKMKMEGYEDEMKAALAKSKKEIEKSRKEFKMPEIDFADIEKNLKHAKVEMQKAKENLKELETMLREMKADGLIDEKDNYEIEYKNGDLFINGKQQSKEVTEKYKKYFKEDPIKIIRNKKAPVVI